MLSRLSRADKSTFERTSAAARVPWLSQKHSNDSGPSRVADKKKIPLFHSSSPHTCRYAGALVLY
jgi:hypothetical protein